MISRKDCTTNNSRGRLQLKSNPVRMGIKEIQNYGERVLFLCLCSESVYSQLVWMLFERGLNNKMSHLHEKALRTAYKDELSDFETLLEKDNAVTIHFKNFNSTRHL